MADELNQIVSQFKVDTSKARLAPAKAGVESQESRIKKVGIKRPAKAAVPEKIEEERGTGIVLKK
jgi:hypothetical protein